MFDPDWNPATDTQAMARVYRQGQTKKTYIYRLFTTGTVEEVIYQKQLKKSNIALLTVDQRKGSENRKMNSFDGKFTREELKDIFTLKENCVCDTRVKIGKKWENYIGSEPLRLKKVDKVILETTKTQPDVLTFVHV